MEGNDAKSPKRGGEEEGGANTKPKINNINGDEGKDVSK